MRTASPATWRFIFVLVVLGLAALALLARMIFIQLTQQDFLKQQGQARSVRTVTLQAMRGLILDRFGEPLAVSTPVDSIWINPSVFADATPAQRATLAFTLGMDKKALDEKFKKAQGKEFVYLKRQLNPQIAQSVVDLAIPGVYSQREYRRYYPMGEAAAHVVGLVNIDGKGVEGLELAYDDYLGGSEGRLKVLKDRMGRVVESLALLKNSEDGHPLQLSLDGRLQYIAHRELKKAVQEHRAVGGSVVVVDVKTGEVLAMVNQPSYNPNNREGFVSSHMRNRAVTDVFEPGSTAKPFSVWVGLQSGRIKPETLINTAPGYWQVHGKAIRDIHNYGTLNVTQVLRKSSNIGVAHVILDEPQESLIEVYKKLGFGEPTYVEFPGERSGYLDVQSKLDPFTYATFAFGYGVSTTAIQLAKAYAVLANDGLRVPLTLLKRQEPPSLERVLEAKPTETLRTMLTIVPEDGGSGQEARIPGYAVGGKTGTVRKLGPTGYLDSHHTGFFVGFLPAEAPRWVCVVVIDDPQDGKYYGGEVAAPVFGRLMKEATRLRAL